MSAKADIGLRRAGPAYGKAWILGTVVDRISMNQAVEMVLLFIAEGRPRQVVTVNPEFVMMARRNSTFRDALNGADMAVPDGIGIVAAAHLLGKPVPERVGGIDLVESLAAHPGSSLRIFMLGGRPGVAQDAARALLRLNAAHEIVGVYAGSPDADEEAAIVEMIRAAKPDLLLVAFGAPAQETWIARNGARLGVPVAIGVGGAFDFLAGRIDRAPRWMQRMGLEWLFRLLHEPWRWRRMLVLPQFAAMVLLCRLTPSFQSHSAARSGHA